MLIRIIIMATTRIALSSVLDTVAKTANTITLTVDTLSSGIEMANSYVGRHRQQQLLTNKLELADFQTRLVSETADRIAERRKAEAKKLEACPEYAKQHKIAYAEIMAILNPEPNPA